MKNHFKILTPSLLILSILFTACERDQMPPLIPPSTGGDTTLNILAGSESGAYAANSAFIDFSTDIISTSGRASWDVAFYCGSDFKVGLNYKTAALTKQINKNDLTNVTAADTIGMALSLSYSSTDFELLDSFSGNLEYTKIPVNATAADNKVFIVQRGTGAGIAAKPWYKIRVLKNSNISYTLQYARITETTFKTIEITKDNNYNFKFVSFDNGLVLSEPKKDDWDIQYTAAVYKFPMGPVEIPYIFSDMVLINYLGGVQAAQVLNTQFSYNTITLANAQSLTYSNDRWAIADKWRTSTSSPTAGVKTDRFYVIKDQIDNYYKLKFISFHNTEGGTRGKPKIAYELIK
ncbi:MAG: HmuY family protein [Chitinophagaceae bacterium]|nr:HmuY family protein [Chitinophagaceae bacterium]